MPSVSAQAQSLDDIRNVVTVLAAKVDARPSAFPTFGSSDHSSSPHIECSRDRFDYVVCEHEIEFERQSTDDIHVLLYWIFKDVTFALACDFELAHRKPRTDCRRLIFSRDEELMALINDGWAERLAAEHEAILKEHPFDDLAVERADFCGQLRAASHVESRSVSVRLLSSSAALASRRVDVHHRGHRRR